MLWVTPTASGSATTAPHAPWLLCGSFSCLLPPGTVPLLPPHGPSFPALPPLPWYLPAAGTMVSHPHCLPPPACESWEDPALSFDYKEVRPIPPPSHGEMSFSGASTSPLSPQLLQDTPFSQSVPQHGWTVGACWGWG